MVISSGSRGRRSRRLFLAGTLPELGNPDADRFLFSGKLLIAFQLAQRTLRICKIQIEHDTQIAVRRGEIRVRANGAT